MTPEDLDKIVDDTRRRVADMQELREETTRLLLFTREATGKSDEATAASREQDKLDDPA